MTKLPSWGVTGWSNTWTALDEGREDDSGLVAGYGIERVVDPGVVHVEQSRVDAVPHWFEKPGSRGRKFQMGWSDDSPPQTQSLLDLHATIAPRRAALVQGDPHLAALDECIDLLVTTAASLHGSQMSLGFIQPDSVRFGKRHDGSRFIVLPDVGFAWDDAGGLMEPEWLSNPSLDLLFEKGARARNAAYLSQLRRPADERDLRSRAKTAAAEELEDVRILARLIVVALVGPDEARRWCGGSKALLSLPGRDIAPDTQAPIWDQVLAPALAGQIPTCSELAMRLAVHRPSAHFLFKPPAPPWRGWEVLRKAAISAAAAGALFGLWLVAPLIFPPHKPAPFCARVRAADPLYQKLESLRDLRDEARVDATKRADYWVRLRECRKDHAVMKSCAHDCLRDPVEEYLKVVEEAGLAVLKSLETQPRPLAEEKVRLEKAAFVIGEALAETDRPGKSPVMIRLERQLRLRGGGVASAPAEKKE
jgi:hypothetical protein